MIELRNVTKTYETGKISFQALKGIDLKISEGEFTGILGPSGSGKSTLMNILGCLDRATTGTYEMDGRDISKLRDQELAHIRNKKIGFVFQSFNLLPRLTIFENVELPMIYAGVPLGERKLRAAEALTKVGLLDWAKHRPNEISGGQKQRVAIARAICNNPRIIMADEPTGNLDSKSALDIMRIFQSLNDEGRTIIMITHEKENIQYLKRVITFRDGSIIEDREVYDRKVLNVPEDLPEHRAIHED
ncbi:ABC transporter ATP-binding protein [Proteiniclasticum sp. BAD-10]|uniref:ABC transporter ATP-binding protein n=1 Tax=Proteiniclasticum sediminis TaxID=2804028 RepID=A0A941CPM7_9CLOT|nr:ABC transporter ATP-binding protein [Proteiniclasticum sediminis]MBR0575769.1 ABC transporter ATP-binding protein [Proteiniclasticum sediminis]